MSSKKYTNELNSHYGWCYATVTLDGNYENYICFVDVQFFSNHHPIIAFLRFTYTLMYYVLQLWIISVVWGRKMCRCQRLVIWNVNLSTNLVGLTLLIYWVLLLIFSRKLNLAKSLIDQNVLKTKLRISRVFQERGKTTNWLFLFQQQPSNFNCVINNPVSYCKMILIRHFISHYS